MLRVLILLAFFAVPSICFGGTTFIGRTAQPVIGVELHYSSEAYTTTQSTSTVRPVSGDFDMTDINRISILIENRGQNSADVWILAALDNSNFSISLAEGIVVKKDTQILYETDSAIKKIRIVASSPSPTSIVTSGYAK